MQAKSVQPYREYRPALPSPHYQRGKETKSVEFGAKVNNIQIDGISFIEHISFKAFNEGVRLKDCIHLQQQLTGVRVKGACGGFNLCQ